MTLNPWKLTGYKPGQNVVCKIVKDEPGGYSVIIPKDALPGFLPTLAKLRTGDEISAQFVCVHNNRVLLSSRFSRPSDPEQHSAPVPKRPLPVTGENAVALPLPEPEEQNET
jgi:hypothetical protein